MPKSKTCKIHSKPLPCRACAGALGGAAATAAQRAAGRRNSLKGARARRKFRRRCTRYRSHVFSPTTRRCPCGFKRRS